jgi:hypothetical protein
MLSRVVSVCWTLCLILLPGLGCSGASNESPEVAQGGNGGEAGGSGAGGESGSGGTALGNTGGSVQQAGGTAGKREVDAGAAPDKDAGVPDGPPPGLVPMFVAAGQGGRTITSCDDGKTWIANHFYENANVDHSPYTNKGLAYGNGMFVVILAWGADVSLKTSTDGVTWTRNTMFDRGFYGGVAFGGDRFVMLRQGVTQYSSDLGKTWKRSRIQPQNDYREGGGGHGLAGAKGVFGGGGGDVPSMSWDGGETFTTANGCPRINYGGIGSQGGIAAGNGHLVFVSSNGDYCHVTDNGKLTTKGNLGGQISGKLFFTGGKFWVASGNTLYNSETGETWSKKSVSPTSVNLHAIAIGDTGTFVGVGESGSDYYRSTDGVAWQKVPGPAGTALFRVVHGYGSASAMCPAK